VSADEVLPVGQGIDELVAAVKAIGRFRLYVHPDTAGWIAVSLAHQRVSQSVELIPDDALEPGMVRWSAPEPARMEQAG
jgi:flagellar biosynthesis/type III secretory pathway protein FliH